MTTKITNMNAAAAATTAAAAAAAAAATAAVAATAAAAATRYLIPLLFGSLVDRCFSRKSNHYNFQSGKNQHFLFCYETDYL